MEIQPDILHFGAELPATEHEDSINVNDSLPLEAKTIYLLLPNNIQVSRAARLQWLLNRLNTIIILPKSKNLNKNSKEIEIISIIPKEHSPSKCNKFFINYRTELIFLAHKYRFVYCIDMSPSQCVVDIEKGEILFDEIMNCFKTSVKGLAKQFVIPGNSIVFQLDIYLTVMVNTPFFISPAQQVLVKGVQISENNLDEIIILVENQFNLLVKKIASIAAIVHDQNELQRIQNEGIVGALFELQENDRINNRKIPMVSPDVNFVNMLRYSMLAISLLPDISISHIVVITDAIVAMPDSNIMESLLFQLHYDGIAVSFIKVGSTFHPHSSAGYVPYTDLLYFLSHSTQGTCLENLPQIESDTLLATNAYHELLLLWSFHSSNKSEMNKIYNVNKWISPNDDPYNNSGMPSLLSKRQTDENVCVSILLLLSKRMREGFTVNYINYINGVIEIKLCLQWKSFIYIIYKVSSQWPIIKNNTRFEVSVSAPYEFLHDITCMLKKDTKSLFRQAIIERFWMRLSQISSSDLSFAQQLSSFRTSSVWYTLPETLRSGVPLFVLNSINYDPQKLILSTSFTCMNFVNIWQSICELETNNWRKWFHTHKVSLILKHDQILSKHAHLLDSSQTYQVIQCRQAATALYGMLSKWASFILIENHTYLKLLHKELDKPPCWFCIVRVTSKLPCAILNIGFITDTPGKVRHEICEELKSELSCLQYMSSPVKLKENVCCILLQKPLEKILIRYERVPNDFNTIIFPDGTQPPHITYNLPSPLTGTLFTTLSRYLYHKRWIWSAAYYSNLKLADNAISRILNALTRMRMKEGFSFAHSSSGILTMVLEVFTKNNASCVVQYVLFPPQKTFFTDDLYSGSEEENDVESEHDSELQIVTEVWIEPQYGQVRSNNKQTNYMNNKCYYEIADVIREVDLQCINSLLTMEHLNLMCQEKRSFNVNASAIYNHLKILSYRSAGKHRKYDAFLEFPTSFIQDDDDHSPRIEYIPFNFDPIGILPLCQQTELLFSMFNDEKDKIDSNKSNKLLLDNIHEHLGLLHDQELSLKKEECKKFTQQIYNRHNEHFLNRTPKTHYKISELPEVAWRCFVKGKSVSHVILTFIPSDLQNIKNLVVNSEKKSSNCLCLPIYVSDCSLSVLIEAHTNNSKEIQSSTKDIYEDHRFKTVRFKEFNYKKKSEEIKHNNASSVDSNKNEDPEMLEQTSRLKHCKILVLIHLKSFTVSLFVALHQNILVHASDVQSAMNQCEESISKIDITEYILTVCGHVKYYDGDIINVKQLHETKVCDELSVLHDLIKEKFFNVLTIAFSPIPTNNKFYFCCNFDKSEPNLNNSDDEHINQHDIDMKLNKESLEESQLLRLEIGTSDNIAMDEINPLFLHLICTINCDGNVYKTPVTVLPTCLDELTKNIQSLNQFDKKKLQVTLDILCLTLPADIQNVANNYSMMPGIKTAPFTGSENIQTFSTLNESSIPLSNLPEYQKKSIISLHEEIEWLLRDEIATSLLDINPTTVDILSFVMKHVTNSNNRTSCGLDIINLNFVYDSDQSHTKFIEEFSKIKVLNYKICREGDLYYLTKDLCDEKIKDDKNLILDKSNQLNTKEDEYKYWLNVLDEKRLNLPNFWLIMKVEQESVTIYFHCRFLHILNDYCDVYLDVEREIRKLCKRVNQSLLLRSLYDTKICDSLLEPDDNFKDWHTEMGFSPSISRNYLKFRNMEEKNDDSEICSVTSDSSLQFKKGYFSCPVVWETHFVLHPRLKTGPLKSGISRGILALKNTLDKFSVSNRNNMFVYEDNKKNVFYLRLHENLQSNKGNSLRSNEYENAIVSRSPSIASLPLGQNKSNLPYCMSSTPINDIRPRVRSFGEKESKDGPNEDTLILKVHGITEAGTDVQCDLIQVLQNRLDDAVLDFLSVMLARNSMCPLTPEDVHFIQKPFKAPEVVIKLSMQEFVLQWLESFVHYLKQNLLQFLNIPKYTDNKSHYHFKDYSEPEQTLNRIYEENIFIYNQSQNPSSGSQGIACIALAIAADSYDANESVNLAQQFEQTFKTKSYKSMVESKILERTDELPKIYLEFRLWKQGRVNIDNLSIKLREAVSQATWDIVMEYYLLQGPLCEENSINNCPRKMAPFDINNSNLDLSKEIEFNCALEIKNLSNAKNPVYDFKRKQEPFKKRTRRGGNLLSSKTSRSITFDDYEKEKEMIAIKLLNTKLITNLTPFETGEDGILADEYSRFLPVWMEFGSKIMTPSIKKHKVNLSNYHLPNVIIKELFNFIQDTPKAFCAVSSHPLNNENDEIFVPYNTSNPVQKCAVISRNFDHWKASTAYNGSAHFPEILNPQALKHAQKFIPITINNKFIPRQKILWSIIERDSITIYTYNWAKDNIDKLISNCSKLGQWLSVRSSFLHSVISQKLGLFHNQAIKQKSFMTSNNPYAGMIGFIDYMIEFPRDNFHKNITSSPTWPYTILEAFRDSFFNYSKYSINDDPVAAFTIEMNKMKQLEKKNKDEIKKLHEMYQSRTSTTTVPLIFLLIKNSRIIHYCHTPLLFLPKWRFKSAATRYNSLHPNQNALSLNKNSLFEEEIWYTELCYGLFCEYRRYLQTLGFMPLQIDNTDRKQEKWRDNSSYNFTFYIQKTILGGILLFTVEFNEPFFTTILHAVECNRLQTVTSKASINRFNLNFLDECDRVKILMHLHSFTYDYHLRCIYNYISNTVGVNKVCNKYDINQFFDDFLKYYNKTPNFARNLIHADTITIKDLVTEGKELYDYLLTNVGQYNFKVVEIEKNDGESEYILVQITSNPQVSYKDSQDCQHTDDFEITLIVSHLCTHYNPTDNVLHLKYYLILTSKREIYPKSNVEQKLGKFRTVSSRSFNLTSEKAPNSLENSVNTINDKSVDTTDVEKSISSSSDQKMNSSNDHSDNIIINNDKEENLIKEESYGEISQESVNYLGYFSSHEQLMLQMIQDKAIITQKHIKDMVAKGMIHCRVHILWNKLLSPQDVNSLTYDEFIELKDLAKLEHLCDVHPNLGPLLNKPLTWYQGLAKLLLVKYSDQNRFFISADGNVQHYVILHPRYFGAFMLLSIDLHTSRGDLYAVYREPHKQDPDICMAYRKALLDGFVNCICFYLWYGMI